MVKPLSSFVTIHVLFMDFPSNLLDTCTQLELNVLSKPRLIRFLTRHLQILCRLNSETKS